MIPAALVALSVSWFALFFVFFWACCLVTVFCKALCTQFCVWEPSRYQGPSYTMLCQALALWNKLWQQAFLLSWAVKILHLYLFIRKTKCGTNSFWNWTANKYNCWMPELHKGPTFEIKVGYYIKFVNTAVNICLHVKHYFNIKSVILKKNSLVVVFFL